MTLREALEGVNDSLWSDGQVSIRPIQTEADLIYAAMDCQLTEAQRDLVNPAWFSIGRAYLFREDNLPCLIYADEQPVGFISLGKWLAKGDAWSWSFFVNKAHQGKGYGRRRQAHQAGHGKGQSAGPESLCVPGLSSAAGAGRG